MDFVILMISFQLASQAFALAIGPMIEVSFHHWMAVSAARLKWSAHK